MDIVARPVCFGFGAAPRLIAVGALALLIAGCATAPRHERFTPGYITHTINAGQSITVESYPGKQDVVTVEVK
jgi:hypothetical protein